MRIPEPARIAVVSGTHMPRAARALPPACRAALSRADAILDAGDLSSVALLEEIEALGVPMFAVTGNVEDEDVRRGLPVERTIDMGRARIALVHDAGPERGRRARMARMARRFPDADGVVFGHAHVPLHAPGPPGPWLLNTGSPTDPRRQPRPSIAERTVGAEGVLIRHLAVDREAPESLPAKLVRGSETAGPRRQ